MMLARVEVHVDGENLTDEECGKISQMLQQLLEYFADTAIDKTKDEFGRDLVLTIKT